VSFADAGPSDLEDLDSVLSTPNSCHQGVSFQLVVAGLVSPTSYSKLFPDLRDALSAAANQARTDQQGVWAEDATTSGATITSLQELDDQLVILPKLFRRLIDYLALVAGTSPWPASAGFVAFWPAATTACW
jgi:hypothetical protein